MAILSDLIYSMAVEIDDKLQPIGNQSMVDAMDVLRRIYSYKVGN